MNADQIMTLTRQTLEVTLQICAPMLVVAVVVGLAISIFQVVTSVQDMTLSIVPRLGAVAVTAFFLSPWMFRRLVEFTVHLLADFHPYVH